MLLTLGYGLVGKFVVYSYVLNGMRICREIKIKIDLAWKQLARPD